MVLRNAVFFLALCAVALTSCLTAHRQVVRAPHPTEVSFAMVMGFSDKLEVAACPASVVQAMERVLTERNLVPKDQSGAALLEAFQSKRLPAHRVAWMQETFAEAPLTLLVETEPRFYSQLSGRYRWTVKARISLVPKGQPEMGMVSEFEGPVFMEFYHQKEAEVLEQAAPILERQLGLLLNEYLSGVGGQVGGP